MATGGQGLSNLEHIALATLKGVGPSMAEKLAKISLYSLQDILFHLPLR